MNNKSVRRYLPSSPWRLFLGVLKAFLLTAAFILKLPPAFWIAVGLMVAYQLPTTPHLRITYSYTGSSSAPRYVECRYFGLHGGVTTFGPRCPIVAMFNPPKLPFARFLPAGLIRPQNRRRDSHDPDQ